MSAILSTQNLVKKYGYKIVSNNISLTINYGFVGKNGAGKTTFMRQVLGLAFPDRYYGDSVFNHQTKYRKENYLYDFKPFA
mgnify:CR=1 FL=1|jgi:ABC-type multidrug transport system ATPase subunit